MNKAMKILWVVCLFFVKNTSALTLDVDLSIGVGTGSVSNFKKSHTEMTESGSVVTEEDEDFNDFVPVGELRFDGFANASVSEWVYLPVHINLDTGGQSVSVVLSRFISGNVRTRYRTEKGRENYIGLNLGEITYDRLMSGESVLQIFMSGDGAVAFYVSDESKILLNGKFGYAPAHNSLMAKGDASFVTKLGGGDLRFGLGFEMKNALDFHCTELNEQQNLCSEYSTDIERKSVSVEYAFSSDHLFRLAQRSYRYTQKDTEELTGPSGKITGTKEETEYDIVGVEYLYRF